MTTIRFLRSHGKLTGFSCVGHSGFAESGADIVCAAVTSAIRLAECIINDALLTGAAVTVRQKNAELSLTLPAVPELPAGCEAVLTGLLLYMRELSRENPNHLTVLEV